MFIETPCIRRIIPVKRNIPGIEFTPGTSKSSFSKPNNFTSLKLLYLNFPEFFTLKETLINNEPDQKHYLLVFTILVGKISKSYSNLTKLMKYHLLNCRIQIVSQQNYP